MSNTERVLYFPEGKIMKTIICDDEKSTCSELEKRENKHSFSGYRIARERWSYGRQIYKRGSWRREYIFDIYIFKGKLCITAFSKSPVWFFGKAHRSGEDISCFG